MWSTSLTCWPRVMTTGRIEAGKWVAEYHMIPLIDGDVLAYAVSFSVQKPVYRVMLDGKVVGQFNRVSERDDWVTSHQPEDIARFEFGETGVSLEPIENAYHNANTTLAAIMSMTKAREYRIFLTGQGNFRETVATIAPYKGNRVQEKPVYLKAIREYLVEQHAAVVIDGEEADDALGYTQMAAPPNSTMIVTVDKDLHMIPGWHMHPQVLEPYLIHPDQALRCFYRQLLTGDRVDNILGCPRIGPKRAAALITEKMGVADEVAMARIVLGEYSKHFDDPVAAVRENGRLLWIRRQPGEMWEIPNEALVS